MKRLRNEIALAAPTAHSVLISGETGSGKELVARELHLASRRSGDFVSVNAAAPSESVFESTMFGHERGAFTGAIRKLPGFLAEAHRGTLFLDEIGTLRMDLQARLLRALETRMFRSIGAHEDTESDFRLIAASNVNLQDAVRTSTFRADFYYRIAYIEIEVPALRDRPEDIPELVSHFLNLFDPHGAVPRQMDDALMDLLRGHDWPGNVRELQRLVGRLALRSVGASRIAVAHLDRRWLHASGDLHATLSIPISESRSRLVEVLLRHSWDTQAAADELGVTRKTVYERMKKAGISSQRRAVR